MPERYPLAGRVLIFTLRAGVRESENFYYKKIYTFPINSKNIDSEKIFSQNLPSKH
nr:MAG TPA: hypothetical protein [Caudoviricetes sp.]